MTDFGDDLRALLAKKKENFFVREMQEERQRQAANKLRDETRRAAARLAREVFLPLLQEFFSVMEQAGVLCGGAVEEAGSEKWEVASEGPPGTSHSPLPTSHSFLVRLRAAGTAPGSPHYEIRVACVATDDGRIDVALACLDRTAAEFSAGETEKPLLEFPPKSFKTPAIHDDAARQWCAGVLKKCAEAIMEAGRRKL